MDADPPKSQHMNEVLEKANLAVANTHRALVILFVALLIGGSSVAASIIISFKLNADRVHQINSERARNTRDSCIAQSQDNEGFQEFVRQAAPQLMDLAQDVFPVRENPTAECTRKANRQVSN